jgi:1-deoxy-D-xylulose-5-phosphate reductoisomerase
MGPKITVDSATMANKGLELIEAHWLFGLSSERLKVVIHPQSIVHSCVQLIDGSILAQMSPPSMTFAIQHCLLYPQRAAAPEATLDFTKAIQFEFRPPDLMRYPCLELAYTALQQGDSAPVIYNAANEVAVAQFLKQQIPFLRIPEIIEKSLHQLGSSPIDCLETLYEVDAAARQSARQLAG